MMHPKLFKKPKSGSKVKQWEKKEKKKELGHTP
jgi:hypothetical protein